MDEIQLFAILNSFHSTDMIVLAEDRQLTQTKTSLLAIIENQK